MIKSEENNQTKEEPVIQCPLCKSLNIEDISTYGNNGVYGHGSASWKISDIRCCNDCGIMFKPVKGNGL